jgi:hypothetical protein
MGGQDSQLQGLTKKTKAFGAEVPKREKEARQSVTQSVTQPVVPAACADNLADALRQSSRDPSTWDDHLTRRGGG